jgi:N-carbamoylputrescine amidase
VTDRRAKFSRSASDDQDETRVVEIDLGRTETVRRMWPFFRDRRIDAFDALTRRARTE